MTIDWLSFVMGGAAVYLAVVLPFLVIVAIMFRYWSAPDPYDPGNAGILRKPEGQREPEDELDKLGLFLFKNGEMEA